MVGGIRSTVIVRRTTGQQVELTVGVIDPAPGHDSSQNSSHSPMLSPAQYSLTIQNRGLKHSFDVLRMIPQKF